MIGIQNFIFYFAKKCSTSILSVLRHFAVNVYQYKSKYLYLKKKLKPTVPTYWIICSKFSAVSSVKAEDKNIYREIEYISM